MPVLLFYSPVDAPEPWRDALTRALPGLDFRVWPDASDSQEVQYALVWKPPAGWLKRFPRLKAILSLGAGVDHLFLDPELPRQVPITRMVDAGLADQMSEYALYGVLHFHRDMGRYAQQQRRGYWHQLPAVPPSQRTVGVMGAGVLGADFVRKLLPLKFPLAVWTRTAKTIPGVDSFHGMTGLDPFLARSQILVNFLPLTAETIGLLNARTLAQLPRGACIVNLARGGHVVESELLGALDSGHLGGAMLDVFAQEPLPDGHPFWQHPKVLVTPHIAGQAIAELMVSQVVDNIRRIERGEPPVGLVDALRGY
jgi:glyoxylate/hydroxypyruvate reductase A